MILALSHLQQLNGNKMKNYLLAFLFFIVAPVLTFAQPENAVVETINGKKYYIHIVEQGNTLYGIQTLYKVKMETILSANPNLNDNLIIGQKILIPVDSNTLSNATTNTSATHTVQAGETLYGISKKYNCTVADLQAINPGISDGISIGQQINVPSKQSNQSTEVIQADPQTTAVSYDISYKDSLVRHTVLDQETLYSISKRYMVSTDTIQKLNNLNGAKVKKGDVLLIPVKKVNYEIIEKQIVHLNSDPTIISNPTTSIERKDVYSVALLLPLMLSLNDAEMAKPLKLDQIREMYPLTKMSFEFYQGFVFAADSLQMAGLSVNIYVYDTKKDSTTVLKIFENAEFASMDLVVGPMYQMETNLTAQLCATRNIPLVLPFKVDAAVVIKNPNVYKTVASNMTLMDGAVDYILANHAHHNVMIVKPTSTSDLAIFDRTRERFNSKIGSVPGAMNQQIVEVTSGSNSGRDMDVFIKKDTTNIIIVPSENIKFVAGIMMRLNSVMNSNGRASKMRIIVFGIEDWNRYEDLDVQHKNRLYQHYATYRFVDYNQGKGLTFVKAYRNRFGTDPTLYSTQGFDVGMYFLGALHLYGKNFDPYLKNYQIELVQNDFDFQPIADGSGRENMRVCIAMYRNYKLVKMSN